MSSFGHFSPLREGDNFVTTTDQMARKMASSFQSPSRRGQLRNEATMRSGTISIFDFSPLREGDNFVTSTLSTAASVSSYFSPLREGDNFVTNNGAVASTDPS